jgi:hypothetical protein
MVSSLLLLERRTIALAMVAEQAARCKRRRADHPRRLRSRIDTATTALYCDGDHGRIPWRFSTEKWRR